MQGYLESSYDLETKRACNNQVTSLKATKDVIM